MVDTIIERRKKFRRSSDRNFAISILSMFAMTFILAAAAGWYIGVEQATTKATDQLKRLTCVDNSNGNR